MVKIKSQKKAAELALNTIVLALLVIIVLVVIITFFMTKIGDTGESLDNNSASSCSVSNPAIQTLGYVNAGYVDSAECTGDWSKISVIPGLKNEEGSIIGVCCGTKKQEAAGSIVFVTN